MKTHVSIKVNDYNELNFLVELLSQKFSTTTSLMSIYIPGIVYIDFDKKFASSGAEEILYKMISIKDLIKETSLYNKDLFELFEKDSKWKSLILEWDWEDNLLTTYFKLFA